MEFFPPSAITPDLVEILLEGSATAAASTYPHEGRTPAPHTPHTLQGDGRQPEQISRY